MSAPLDLAYFAGIIDARAHIEPGRGRLTVSTRRAELLRWVAARTGVSVTLDERPYQRRACSEHCTDRHQHVARQSAYWTCRGMRAAIICDAVLPWLVETRVDAFALVRGEVGRVGWPSDPALSEIGAGMLRLGWPLPTPAAGAS